jgi:hypothetical protein
MKSIRHLLRIAITVTAIAITAPVLLPAEDTHPKKIEPLQEPAYFNKPLSYWLGVIRDRDEKKIALAFEAIRGLGPDAWAAVPDLTRLVAAPFTPIHIGKDSHEMIAAKLYDITLRDEAIDTLTVIGESSSTATLSLVRWALTQRVVPGIMRNEDDDELFIELVMMDTEQRMRVAGAISEFGPDAAPVIAALISSQDAEKRKLGVAILSEGALPIAAEMLRSGKCEERVLGFQILKDMELVVAKPYIDELMRRLVCDAN